MKLQILYWTHHAVPVSSSDLFMSDGKISYLIHSYAVANMQSTTIAFESNLMILNASFTVPSNNDLINVSVIIGGTGNAMRALRQCVIRSGMIWLSIGGILRFTPDLLVTVGTTITNLILSGLINYLTS